MSEIIELARTAGTTLVTLMTSEAWTRMRNGLVSLWRAVHPDSAETVEQDLEASRSELLAAHREHDEALEQEIRVEWQSRLRRLLAEHPESAQSLRQLLEEVSPSTPAHGGTTIRMQAKASGKGRVYQAGRDQHITER
ncbi:hypothetical protein [Streptomyces sp. NPDC093984]|uniref:hypothetical protein n=1 Tax=Streptomyces sp. NPDC093984 TaxID=3366052 RepID=UPI00382C418D